MTIADKFYRCPWCPNFFCTQLDLDNHLKAFKVTGVKPNEYDHRVVWKNIMLYREKREPYEAWVC